MVSVFLIYVILLSSVCRRDTFIVDGDWLSRNRCAAMALVESVVVSRMSLTGSVRSWCSRLTRGFIKALQC